MGDEKSKFQTLEKELKKEFNNAWEKIENRDEVFDLADEYKSFLDKKWPKYKLVLSDKK